MEDTIQRRFKIYKEKALLILASAKYDFSTSKVVPRKLGLYIIYNVKNEIIYVGKTNDLRRRLFQNHRTDNIKGSHFRRAISQDYGFRKEEEISKFVGENCLFQFHETREDQSLLEHFLIAMLHPQLNR